MLSNHFPLPSSHGVEVDFLQNQPFEFQDIGNNCVYDTNTQEFIARTSIIAATIVESHEEGTNHNKVRLTRTHDCLVAAIQTLNTAKQKKSNKQVVLSLSEATCWEDVIAAVKGAQGKYLQKDSPSSKVRAAFRKVEDNAKSIQPFLGLLPDGQYKTLCGGLTLVLEAMMKKAEMRENIADLLDQLPDTLQSCEDYAAVYPGKNTLRNRIEDLYIRIVEAIETLIIWYSKKSLNRTTKAFFKNDGYTDDFNLRLKSIEMAKKNLNEEANMYLHWRARLIEQGVMETNKRSQEMSANMAIIGNRLWEELQKESKAAANRISSIETNIVNGISGVLKDYTKNSGWTRERDKYRQRIRDLAARVRELEAMLVAKTVQSDSLARRLHLTLPADGCRDNAQTVLASGITQRTRYQARSKFIADNQEFRDWYIASDSQFLCINGNFEQDSFSPTAFLASMIVDGFKSNPQDVLCLPFFCGLHTDTILCDDVEVSGPTLLLRTLIAQILCLSDMDDKQYLSFLTEEKVEEMEDMSKETYLDVLKQLIRCLMQEYKAVFIVLDGVEFYDSGKNRSWMKKVMKHLARMTREEAGVGGSLKVLMMASSYCSIFSRESGLEALDIPEEIECDGEGYESLGELS